MNSSKKVKKKKVKKDRLIEQKPITSVSKPWIIVSALLIVILVGALLFDEFYEKTLITIDGDKYKMNDLSYYVYEVEAMYEYYDQLFGGNGAYWDMQYDESSVRDMAMDDVIDKVLQTEILYREAAAAGYELTEEETEEVGSNVESLLNNQLTEAEIEKNNFTEKYLTKYVSRETLVSRYRQDLIDALNIDDEAIKESIDYDEYRQYDIEYFFISTETTDEDDNKAAMSEEEKAAAYDKINAVYESAKTADDWSALLSEDEEELTYKKTSFLESGTTFSEDMEAMMMAMKNGDISGIYEAESGYYMVRMIDNNSSESYDNAVDSAISTAEEEGFSELYEEIAAEHEYTVNNSALSSYTMGSITLAE